jgi:hypothetical protein
MSRLPTGCVILLLATLATGAATAAPAGPASATGGAAFQNVPELEAGYRFLYEQKFLEARGQFSGWSRKNSGDPFGDVSVAASYLFEEFYRQGIMTSDYFLDDDRFLHGIEGKPDAGRLGAFYEALARVDRTAKQRLKKDPADPDALFALTLSAGMRSNALSILEKKNLDGLRQLKQANANAERLLSAKPDTADAWLALGSANYIIGCLSGPVRFFLWFGGYHGDRELGMQQLGKTVAGGRYLGPYAKILLALAARREGQEDLARRLLRELTREYPDSPLFAAEYARVPDDPGPTATQ